MKRVVTMAIMLAAASLAGAALADPASGKNTINGHVPGGICAQPVVYLYPYFPEISGADGSSKLPQFELPAPRSEHWEAPCTAGAFNFRSVPDGSYVAGMPGTTADRRALVADATVVDGQTLEVELKPQTPAH
jgi:hypothetical protein